MDATTAMIHLGFTEKRFPVGTHICQIYSTDEERENSLQQFLLSGLRDGECTACFSESLDEAEFGALLGESGISLEEKKHAKAFSLAGTSEVYFQDGRFDPDRMLGLLRDFHETAVAAGFPAARVIGEMTAEIGTIEGGSRLLEYESRVSQLLRRHPVTSVCQYDAREFDGATIMDVLKVHPLMVVRGSVVMNPFYIPPEQFLAAS